MKEIKKSSTIRILRMNGNFLKKLSFPKLDVWLLKVLEFCDKYARIISVGVLCFIIGAWIF